MITKYTNCEVLEVKSADEKIEGNAKLSSFDHIPQETYRTNDGYIYVKVRAISSRVNKNFDGWPVNELAGVEEKDFRGIASTLSKTADAGGISKLTFTRDSKDLNTKGDFGFRTFVGRPVFIDHNNSDPKRARGVVVDAMLHIEGPQKTSADSYWSTAPENHAPETWVELLLEVDGKSFPKLAKALLEGKINAVSMGCNVEYTLCSICNHKAASVDEYCSHIKKKGMTFKTGSLDKLAYEDCYNVNFFEISAVFDPADVTALFTEPIIKSAATTEEAQEPPVMTDILRLLEDLMRRTERQVAEVKNSENGQSNEQESASMQEFIDIVESRAPSLKDGGVNVMPMVSAAKTYKNFLDGMAKKVEYMSTADQADFEMYLTLAQDVTKQIENFYRMYGKVADLFKQRSLENIQQNYERSPSAEDYDFLMDNKIDPRSLLSKRIAKIAMSSNPLLQKAFEMGEMYQSNPVDIPEFDSVKMAEYLGTQPHDPNMHEYMKAYEDGVESSIRGGYNLKDARNETQSLEDSFNGFSYEGKIASMNTEKYGESITAPSKINTLKNDKPCPIGLAGECGLDDESGKCEKCGYQEPPAPLSDPDLSKAKAFDRKKEQNKEEFRTETKGLIHDLKRILSKNEIRSVNNTMNNKTAKITLSADVEEVPSDEYLAELGWTVPEKESSASSSAIPLVEDGKPASDRPREEKVISDQLKPVESATKVALGELPGLNQPNGGESTPQYKGDKNNETSGISEHLNEGPPMDEQYKSVKKEVEQPQYADEGETRDIRNHNPETMPEQYQSVKKEVEKPQFADEGGTKGISEHHAELPGRGRESAVLSAIKLADLEVELGLNEVEMKYARVAELENEQPSVVEAKYETLLRIKEAGLGKRETPAKKLAGFPSFKGVKESSVSSTSGGVPDDAIFN